MSAVDGLVIGPGGSGGFRPDRDEGRRRASAQQRLRRVASQLDTLTGNVEAIGIPVVRDLEPPTLTAGQLRLAADLLDHPTWGQLP